MKRVFLPVWTALLLLAFACKEIPSPPTPDPPVQPSTPTLTLGGASSLEIADGGGVSTLTFTTNRDWTVQSSASWVRVSPASGSASDKAVSVSVTVDANTTYEERTATVTITAGGQSQTVTVKQAAAQKPATYIRVTSDGQENPSVILFDRTGWGDTAASLAVDTNAETDPATWEITCSEPWCHYTLNTNAGHIKYIMLTADEYGSVTDYFWPRSGEVRIKIPGLYDGSFRVVQESRPYMTTPYEYQFPFLLSPSGAVREVPVFTNLYDWKIDNENDWVVAEKSGPHHAPPACHPPHRPVGPGAGGRCLPVQRQRQGTAETRSAGLAAPVFHGRRPGHLGRRIWLWRQPWLGLTVRRKNAYEKEP